MYATHIRLVSLHARQPEFARCQSRRKVFLGFLDASSLPGELCPTHHSLKEQSCAAGAFASHSAYDGQTSSLHAKWHTGKTLEQDNSS
jgi:hypothetical protein